MSARKDDDEIINNTGGAGSGGGSGGGSPLPSIPAVPAAPASTPTPVATGATIKCLRKHDKVTYGKPYPKIIRTTAGQTFYNPNPEGNAAVVYYSDGSRLVLRAEPERPSIPNPAWEEIKREQIIENVDLGLCGITPSTPTPTLTETPTPTPTGTPNFCPSGIYADEFSRCPDGYYLTNGNCCLPNPTSTPTPTPTKTPTPIPITDGGGGTPGGGGDTGDNGDGSSSGKDDELEFAE